MRLDREIGVSYRQLDWWTRRGYIYAEKPGGSGIARTYSEGEKQIAMMMGQLVEAGFRAERAAFWARLAYESDTDLLELGSDVLLCFGKLSAGGNLGSNRAA